LDWTQDIVEYNIQHYKFLSFENFTNNSIFGFSYNSLHFS
jgi:hypothetical protein